MILLDTDHLTVLLFPEDSKFKALTRRLDLAYDPNIVASVVNLEEQMRGWLARINRCRSVSEQTKFYPRLASSVTFYSRWRLLPFDQGAADIFTDLRKRKTPVASQDLKIASIALANDALLLSANPVDFQKVPGLKVEDWLYEKTP